MFRNWESDDKVTEFLQWQTARDISEAEHVLSEWVQGYKNLDIVHIGYCIGSKWWHQGITSEAFKAIISFFFEEVGVNRIESQHDPNNPAWW